jgi:hypothetical protein
MKIRTIDSFDQLARCHSPIRHETLSPTLLERLAKLWPRVREYLDHLSTLEQWEEGFMHDTYPENEALVWEKIADAMDRLRPIFPNIDPQALLDIVLDFSVDLLPAAKRVQRPFSTICRVARECGVVPAKLEVYCGELPE